MWLAPFDASASPADRWLEVRLGATPVAVAALRVWNYNKSPDDTARGVKAAAVLLDGRRVSPPAGFIFSKAPGTDTFDYGQTVALHAADEGSSPALPLAKQGVSFSRVEAAAWLAQLPPRHVAAVLASRGRAAGRNHNELVRQDFETPLLPCGHVFKCGAG